MVHVGRGRRETAGDQKNWRIEDHRALPFSHYEAGAKSPMVSRPELHLQSARFVPIRWEMKSCSFPWTLKGNEGDMLPAEDKRKMTLK